jgi:hypothetical protein
VQNAGVAELIDKTKNRSRQRDDRAQAGAIESFAKTIHEHGEASLAGAVPRRNALHLQLIVKG